MNRKGILVTGFRGFVGQAVVWALEAEGKEWWGVDLQGGGPLLDISSIAPQDLADTTAVIHLAAVADVSQNWASSAERQRHLSQNIVATHVLLEACAEAPSIRRFVFASTGAVYGDCFGQAKSEDAAVVATSPYAASKLAGEAYVQAFAYAKGWEWYCLRLAAVVGCGYHHGHIVDILKAQRGGRVFKGRDRGDRKSMIHVDDVAEVMRMLACGYPLPESAPQASGVYNLSAGSASWRDSAALAGAEHTAPTNAHGWVGDGCGITMSHAKLSRALGWQPRRTVEEGIIEAIKDIRSRT